MAETSDRDDKSQCLPAYTEPESASLPRAVLELNGHTLEVRGTAEAVENLRNSTGVDAGKEFIDSCISDVVVINRSRTGDLTENVHNTLAMIRELKPQDPTEALLITQMTAVHQAAIRMAYLLSVETRVEVISMKEKALNRLSRTFAQQVETLKKYRTGGQQKITVQHVQMSDNAQAVFGDVGGGSDEKK
ncbi:MAG: hypothetical protein GY807_02195 [Gammaproteobacteria bacterium]|nr:hypothetical protein [Gammaproteobacteria bacterium]